jgi:hypothetical protein
MLLQRESKHIAVVPHRQLMDSYAHVILDLAVPAPRERQRKREKKKQIKILKI